MQIQLDRAVEGLLGYMSDLVSSIPKDIDKLLGTAAVAGLRKKPGAIVSRVKPWMEMSGILSDNMVDLDTAKYALDQAFAAVPKVSYFGFTFTGEDVDALLAKMQAA